MGHSSLTFKFTLGTQHLTTSTPHIQGEHPEEGGLTCWSKILPQLLVMVTGLSEVSTNQCSTFLFHNSYTVPVSAMLFQKEQQLPLTQRTHVFMLKSFRGYCIHFTRVQNSTSALKTKPNEANMDCSCCKAEFSPMVQCCMLNSTLDSAFYGVLLQSVFRTIQKLFND